MTENFITFDMLKNFATLATVLVIVTQFTKDLVDALFGVLRIRVPTRYLVFVYALAVLLLILYRGGPVTVEAVVATIINAIFVTLTAMKAFESAVQPALEKLSKPLPPGPPPTVNP